MVSHSPSPVKNLTQNNHRAIIQTGKKVTGFTPCCHPERSVSGVEAAPVGACKRATAAGGSWRVADLGTSFGANVKSVRRSLDSLCSLGMTYFYLGALLAFKLLFYRSVTIQKRTVAKLTFCNSPGYGKEKDYRPNSTLLTTLSRYSWRPEPGSSGAPSSSA